MKNNWYVEHNGKAQGPFSDTQLKKLAKSGKVNPTSKIRLQDDGSWHQASKIKGLFVSKPAGVAKVTDSSEPEGWVKARWGMTPEAVLQAYPSVSHHDPPLEYEGAFVPFELLRLKIGIEEFDVKFQFSNDKRVLRQVQLIPSDQEDWSVEKDFKYMTQLITEKYGPPKYSDDDNKSWVFQKTKISVSMMNLSVLAQSSIMYTAERLPENNLL